MISFNEYQENAGSGTQGAVGQNILPASLTRAPKNHNLSSSNIKSAEELDTKQAKHHSMSVQNQIGGLGGARGGRDNSVGELDSFLNDFSTGPGGAKAGKKESQDDMG